MATGVIRCSHCDTTVILSGNEVSCICGRTHYLRVDGIYVSQSPDVDQIDEIAVRDRQAGGYLLHDKFPTQIACFDNWLKETGASEEGQAREVFEARNAMIALDLGC